MGGVGKGVSGSRSKAKQGTQEGGRLEVGPGLSQLI